MESLRSHEYLVQTLEVPKGPRRAETERKPMDANNCVKTPLLKQSGGTGIPNPNVGYICTGYQCRLGKSQKRAMTWLGSHGEREDCSFADLDRESSKFANVLKGLNYSRGDVLFTYLPKIPTHYFVLLGGLKQRLTMGPLFVNFGEEALLDRLADSKARGIVTRKVGLARLKHISDRLPSLQEIILVDSDQHLADNILSYNLLMTDVTDDFEVPVTSPETPSLLHYTSGSTGKPKGVLHCHGSLPSQQQTGQEVLQLSSDDIFWCTADPGWVTGTSYGIISPWSLGVTQIHYGGGYDAQKWFEILEKEHVTIWYTAPTALRMLMREEERLLTKYDLSKLRYIFSVGEPLNPEAFFWGQRVLRKDIHDTWFQTETGAIMIANRPELEVRAGSMGKPVNEIQAEVVDERGEILPVGKEGHLCLKPGWNSMFVAYLNRDEDYAKKFRHGWYWSGDLARRDREGYFWFVGRSDDVINTAGHLVSPFEVESALLELPEVAESAAIGAPDELFFEKVVAFVVLRPGIQWTKELELKIRLHVSNKVSTTATPQDLVAVSEIPKNKSGKIMRRVLKANYLALDAGDLSTLEI